MVFVLPYCHTVDTYSQNEVNEQQTAFDAIKIELRNSFKVTKTPKNHISNGTIDSAQICRRFNVKLIVIGKFVGKLWK